MGLFGLWGTVLFQEVGFDVVFGVQSLNSMGVGLT